MADIISQTTPTNIAAEKLKFFANDTYNPQLTYKDTIDEIALQAWGLPQPKIVDHSLKFLAEHYPKQAVKKTGDTISEAEIQSAIEAFNAQHQLQPPIELLFSENLVAKCKVSGHTIYFHRPVTYSHSQFLDLCRHEIETHILRNYNHALQPWRDVKIPELDIRRTEEGWAGLHTFLYRENKIMLKSYVTYLAVHVAQQASFRDVYNRLRQIGVSQDLAWRISLRTKRGLRDTSQPGGLTRDLCYLEGALMVWDWLINQHQDPKDCYLGRLPLADISTYKPQADLDKIRYPSFMVNISEYLQHIRLIGQINEFETLL